MLPDTSASASFFKLFELDLQKVLAEEISEAFRPLEGASLKRENLGRLKAYELKNPTFRKGLYILFHNGVAKYVGKSDDSLYSRLDDHRVKIGARLNISVEDILFKCLYLDKNWSAMAHEGSLIKSFCSLGGWNSKGFGNHDPGRERDTTVVKEGHFDRLYPINPDSVIPELDEVAPGKISALIALRALKIKAPYLVRFQDAKGRAKRDYEESKITLSSASVSARTLVGLIVDALGSSWQATFLYGYLIVYRDTKQYGMQCAQTYKLGGDSWKTPSRAAEDEQGYTV